MSSLLLALLVATASASAPLPSKLGRSKVLALRGGETNFADFTALEKFDLIAGTLYAVNLFATPSLFNEQCFGDKDSSDVAVANAKYCGITALLWKYCQYLVFKHAPEKVKAQQGLGWAMFAALSSFYVNKFKVPMMKGNVALQVFMTGAYVKRLMKA